MFQGISSEVSSNRLKSEKEKNKDKKFPLDCELEYIDEELQDQAGFFENCLPLEQILDDYRDEEIDYIDLDKYNQNAKQTISLNFIENDIKEIKNENLQIIKENRLNKLIRDQDRMQNENKITSRNSSNKVKTLVNLFNRLITDTD